MQVLVKRKEVNLALYSDISKQDKKLEKYDRISNLGSFHIKSQLYVDSIPTTSPNNLFTKSCEEKNTCWFFYPLALISYL